MNYALEEVDLVHSEAKKQAKEKGILAVRGNIRGAYLSSVGSCEGGGLLFGSFWGLLRVPLLSSIFRSKEGYMIHLSPAFYINESSILFEVDLFSCEFFLD